MPPAYVLETPLLHALLRDLDLRTAWGGRAAVGSARRWWMGGRGGCLRVHPVGARGEVGKRNEHLVERALVDRYLPPRATGG